PCLPGQVGDDGDRPPAARPRPPDHLPGAVAIDVGDDEVGALAGEELADGPADAAGAGGDHRHLPTQEPTFHPSPPLHSSLFHPGRGTPARSAAATASASVGNQMSSSAGPSSDSMSPTSR